MYEFKMHEFTSSDHPPHSTVIANKCETDFDWSENMQWLLECGKVENPATGYHIPKKEKLDTFVEGWLKALKFLKSSESSHAPPPARPIQL